MNQKWISPKQVQQIYGVAPSTLSRQRWGKYGLGAVDENGKPIAYTRFVSPGAKRGLVRYSIEKLEDVFNKKININNNNRRRNVREELGKIRQRTSQKN